MVGLIFVCLLSLVAGRTTHGATRSRPNILFILVDDLDYQTAVNPRLLPRVNRLAREGTTFARAYAQHGLCSPSRATMLTGRYAQNTGVRRNTTPFGGFQTFRANGMERASINVWLQQAGYRTGLIGKFINGYPRTAADNHVPPGWNYWAVSDWSKPYHYRVNENGRWSEFGSDATAYDTDVYSRKAQQFIRRAADEAEPFALFLWFGAIHAPVAAAPRHADLFPTETVPRRPSYNERLVYDKPPFLRYPALTAEQSAGLDEKYRQRLRSAQAVDEAVGALYDLLADRRLLADTYIVLASDNGFHLGEHRLQATKGFAYEDSIRLPLMVRGPGVPAGRTLNQLVGNADLAPTFADWAGLKVPAAMDGRSFAPLLAAADPARVRWRWALPLASLPESRKQLATDWPELIDPARRGGYGCIATKGWSMPQMRGVRTRGFTFTHYASGDMELYDTAANPDQLNNRICTAAATTRDRLRQLAEALSTCRSAGCRALENRYVP